MNLNEYINQIERQFNSGSARKLNVDINVLLTSDNKLVVTNQSSGNKLKLSFHKSNREDCKK